MIPWWKTVFGSEAAQAAFEAVNTGRMVLGPLTQQLEKCIGETLNVPYVVGTCSGTAALTIALLEAGAGPGVDVIVPDQTWVATANAVMLAGARVILADIEKDRRLLDPAAFEAAITPNTKIVIPVHLNGKAANMPSIRAIAKRHDITVIEDACQSFNSVSPEGGYLGTHSSAGCFSMAMGKIICAGQGGFVVTHDAERARRLRLARLHGTDDVYAGKWEVKGGNFRLWDLPAAIALQQFGILRERMEACRAVYRFYADAMQGCRHIRLVPFDLDAGEFPLYAECLCDARENFLAYMAEHGVQCRANYQPLHTVAHFYDGNNASCFANSISYGSRCVILPCGPSRDKTELETTVELVLRWDNR